MFGINLLIVIDLWICLHGIECLGVTIIGKPAVRAAKAADELASSTQITGLRRAQISHSIVDEDRSDQYISPPKSRPIQERKEAVNHPKKQQSIKVKNGIPLQRKKDDGGKVGKAAGKKEGKGPGGVVGAKRYDISMPEDTVSAKNEETMVVIDEEDGDEPHGETIKENPEDSEGYTIVLDNSISHNSNTDKNNKSLKELSKSFSSMDSRLKNILDTEKKRQRGKEQQSGEVAKGNFGRNQMIANIKGRKKKDDYLLIEDSKLMELQKRLNEEGTDDEFIKLVKESQTKKDTKPSKESSKVELYEANPHQTTESREGGVVRRGKKRFLSNPDPLERFNQEQTFPIIKEADEPGNLKSKAIDNAKSVRKAALPLTNPHPTKSTPIKGVPLTQGKRRANESHPTKSDHPSVDSSDESPQHDNETENAKKTGIVATTPAKHSAQTKKLARDRVTSTRRMHPTSYITLVTERQRFHTNATSKAKSPTLKRAQKTSRTTAPVLSINIVPTSQPSVTPTTLDPKRHNVETNTSDTNSTENSEDSPSKNTSSVKITITPDNHPSDEDEDESAEGERPQIIDPWKAQTMLEYINKDPLEVWIYVYKNLKMLGLNSTMLRNGLVNAGSIDRIKSAMKRALKGEDITLSIVGGSISAGGGLYKDRGNIDGLYYKGLADWWNKAITPLTGSSMVINNVAIGSIGTDYFSYCVRNHIVNETDLVLWELSGNDYNRYVTLPTKGAKPLERLTRMILQLPKQPALLYVNFFKGIDYKVSKTTCPNFEDQGEDIIAHYYKLPSLSWRSMVCEPLLQHQQLFTLRTLFSNDQYHPSLRAHAQMSLLLILHLRHVMRSVLKWAAEHKGTIPDFADNYIIPPPLFVGLELPQPLCWTLITPDMKERITNSLDVRVVKDDGYKLDYATNFPVRYDRVICWKAEHPGSEIQVGFEIPQKSQSSQKESRKSEVAITTHTRWFGSAEVWLDERPESPPVIEEGRKGDTGRRTQVDVIAKDVSPGQHVLTVRAKSLGFCLAAIMIN